MAAKSVPNEGDLDFVPLKMKDIRLWYWDFTAIHKIEVE